MSCAYCKDIDVCAICGKGVTAAAFHPAPTAHDYPACGIFRGGKCTCVLQDPPDLIALAQRCGASVMYPTGELPRAPEVTFRPEAWRQFAAAHSMNDELRAAAQQAIEAMERLWDQKRGGGIHIDNASSECVRRVQNAIRALRSALAAKEDQRG